MNQEKIGKFIAESRRKKGMTQSELAEKLGVTDKSIGNWENGRNMPDLSLFKPLCDELDISINELISGEVIKRDDYQEKFEENIINTIDYTNKKIIDKNNLVGVILIIFGALLVLTAMSILPSESSFGSIYSILGMIISFIGIARFTKRLEFWKRLLFHISYFILFILFLLAIDYIGAVTIKQAPFYNVYRVNYDTENEYYIIDTKKEYTMDTVPNVPFNRSSAGIENIIKYKNKYVGNNSNMGNLIFSLPLSEYGYTFEIDSKDLGLTINYHITDWYINENYYLEKSLVYNSVSIFALIENVETIHYNFSGKSYRVERSQVEKDYPNYSKIIENGIDIDNFNQYLENKINDDDFIDRIFNKLYQAN